MKTGFLIATTILILATSAYAENNNSSSLFRCTPPYSQAHHQYRFIQPHKIEEMLRHLRSEIGDERLERALGTSVLRSLETYSDLNDHQVTANIYVAAAAGGAAAAVVEYVWDRLVGNGPKKDQLVSEDYFDIMAPNRPTDPGKVPPLFHNGGIPKLAGIHPLPRHRDPVLLTPAVASAAAGAVAYKAVEYSMRKAFGEDFNPNEPLTEESFDLNN